MQTKTHVTITNIVSRLTSEEIKFLAIKYRELCNEHCHDAVKIEKEEFDRKAKLYGEALEISRSRNYVRTIHYGKNGRNRINVI